MKDRIEIDGEWYVLESATKESDNVNESNIICYYAAQVESETALFEFSVHLDECNEDKPFNNSAVIEYTNKVTREEEYWDNTKWLCHFRDGFERMEKSNGDNISKSDEMLLLSLLKNVTDKGWL